MESTSVLESIAEVAIALAGFGGIAAGLGYRSRGTWSSDDQLRLMLLAGTGLAVVFACFLTYVTQNLGSGCTLLALTLLSAGLSQDVVWALSSVAWVVLVLPFTAWAISRGSRLAEDRTVGLTYRVVVSGVVLATAATQLANAIFLQEFWPFFLALAVILILGVTQFFRLLWFGLFR